MHTIDKKLSLSIVGTVTLCVVKFQRKGALAFLKRIDFKFDRKEEIGKLKRLATIDANKLISHKPSILIVEDSEDVRIYLNSLLKNDYSIYYDHSTKSDEENCLFYVLEIFT